MGATQIAPGKVSHYGPKLATLGPFPTSDPKLNGTPEEKERLEKFGSMLSLGGGDVTIKYDPVEMQAERWKKTAWYVQSQPPHVTY